MNLQREFEAAGEEYARRLEKQREADRLEALRIEARQQGAASAFAEFFEAALQQPTDDHTDTDNQEIQ